MVGFPQLSVGGHGRYNSLMRHELAERDKAPVWATGASPIERVLRRGAGWEAIRSHLGS